MTNLRINTGITKKRLRDHFQYAKWQYIAVAILMAVSWEFIYSVTAYRPPDDKVISTYICTPSMGMDTEAVLAAQTASLFPHIESITFQHIALGSSEDYYANMQLTTYIGAREGDIFLLPAERFRVFAQEGLFIPLDSAIERGKLNLEGIDTSACRFTLGGDYTQSGETVTGTFGIPAADLYGLMDLSIDNRDLIFGVTTYSGNPDDAIGMINWLIGRYKTPKPDWVTEAEQQTQMQDEALPSY